MEVKLSDATARRLIDNAAHALTQRLREIAASMRDHNKFDPEYGAAFGDEVTQRRCSRFLAVEKRAEGADGPAFCEHIIRTQMLGVDDDAIVRLALNIPVQNLYAFAYRALDSFHGPVVSIRWEE